MKATGTPEPVDRRTGHPHGGNRRRNVALLLLIGLVATGAAAGLAQLSPNAADPPPAARPLSEDEAQRLARMRQLNWDEEGARLRVTAGPPGQRVHATGWVDWRHPVVYLAVSGSTPGAADLLVQATPDTVATRSGPWRPESPQSAAGGGPATVAPHPPPPQQPPADGWQAHRLGTGGPVVGPSDPGTIDALVVLLLSLASEDRAASDLLVQSGSRWLRHDRAGGAEVDVLLGPANPPTAPPGDPERPAGDDLSLANLGGAIQYWLDDEARLHRIDALLAADMPVQVELDREEVTAPEVIDALGGAPVSPRPVTEEEAATLSRLRQQNRASGGGEIRMSLVEGDGLVRAAGWLDWRRPAAYLAVRAPEADDSGLLWAEAGRVATQLGTTVPPLDDVAAVPTPEAVDDWHWQLWEERADEHGGYPLDLLVNEALSLTGWSLDDPSLLRDRAVWLRADEHLGRAVGVYEMPRDSEEGVDPGSARMRYWVDDATGVLQRLELRTRTGAFAQLDLLGGELPDLGWPVRP